MNPTTYEHTRIAALTILVASALAVRPMAATAAVLAPMTVFTNGADSYL